MDFGMLVEAIRSSFNLLLDEAVKVWSAIDKYLNRNEIEFDKPKHPAISGKYIQTIRLKSQITLNKPINFYARSNC